MNLPVKKLTHELCFQNKGKTASIWLELNADEAGNISDKNMADSLAA